MSKALNNSRVRVLVVDNEKRVVELHQQLLGLWGYSSVIAEGTGTALIKDAKLKAKKARCQIALVDMRLIDDFDEEDISGLDLIDEIRPAETIIVSGYGTLNLALMSVLERGAVDFFEKSASPTILKEMIDKIAEEKCASHKEISIEASQILRYIKETLFLSNIPEKYHDQIYDILVRLFPKATSLRLEKVSSSSESSNYSTVPRPGSVILRVYEDDLQSVIVKMARSKKINKEVKRFNEYIRGRLGVRSTPVLEDYIVLWDIGGMKLSSVGSIEETFANFIPKHSIAKIEASLKHFFLETWSPHYKNAQDESDVSLLRRYCDVWGQNWLERASSISMPKPSGMMKLKFWKKVRFNNPLDLLETMKLNEGGRNDPSMVEATRTAITHGDLHADNLLIDNSQHGWVVDFERTGRGHALQDFVELEADIIIRTTCAREDFSKFYHFCLTITSANPIDEISPINPSLVNDSETEKTLSIITFIRKLAIQSTNITDARQYLLGLYFNIIFRATLEQKGKKKKYNKRELRTWMLASILCYMLSR
jgi:ActR/RegA family two-component response regulator